MEFDIIRDQPMSPSEGSKTIMIIFAEDGSQNEIQLSSLMSSFSMDSSSALMKHIEREHGILSDDQVILRFSDGKQLIPSLDMREFFEKDQTVFVFNTRSSQEVATSQNFEVISPGSPDRNGWEDIGLASANELYQAFVGSESNSQPDPSRTVYPKWLEGIMIKLSDIKNEISSLSNESMRLKRQKDSETSVKRHLMNYYMEKNKKNSETLSQMKAKMDKFQSLLDNFDTSMERLSKLEVHPIMGDNDKRYLIEYFDADRIRSDKRAYEKNQAKIMLGTQEMGTTSQDYEKQFKKIGESLPDYYEEIMDRIENEDALLMKIQEKSVRRFRSLMEKDLKKLTMDELEDFIDEEFWGNVDKLKNVFQSLQRIRMDLRSYQRDNSMRLRNLVANLFNITFEALMERHEKDLFHLELIAEFPSIYQASVKEMQRKSRSKDDCLAILKLLETLVTSENKSRKEFSKNYEAYIPKSLPVITRTLLQLDFDDLYRSITQDEGLSLRENPLLLARTGTLRLCGLKSERLENFAEYMRAMIERARNEIPEGSNMTLEELLREMQRRSDNHIRMLSMELEAKKMENEELLCSLRQMEQQLQRLMMERDEIAKGRLRSEETIQILNEKIMIIEEMKMKLEQTIATLQRNLISSEKGITSMNMELTEREKEIGMLGSQMDDLTQKNKKAYEIIDQRDRTISEHRLQIENLQKRLDAKVRQITGIKRAMVTTRNEVKSLTEENNRLDEMIARKESTLTALQEKYRESQTRLEMVEKKMAEREQMLMETEKSLKMFEETVEALRCRTTELDSELLELQERNKVLMTQKKNLETTVEKNQRELGSTKTALELLDNSKTREIIAMNKEKDSLSKELMAMRKERDETNRKMTEMSSRMTRMEEEMRMRDQTLERSNKELETSKTCLMNLQSSRSNEMNTLAKEKEALQKELESLRKSQETTSRDLTSRITKLEEELKAKTMSLEKTSKELETTRNSLQATEKARTTETTSLTKEKESLMKEMERMKKDKEESVKRAQENTTQEFSSKMTKLQEELRNRERTNEKLQKELEANKAALQMLETSKATQIVTSNKEKETLMKDLETSRKEKDELKKNIKEMTSRMTKMEEELKKKDQMIERTQAQLETTQASLTFIQGSKAAEISKLTKEKESLMKELDDTRKDNETTVRDLNSRLSKLEHDLNGKTLALEKSMKDLTTIKASSIANESSKTCQINTLIREKEALAKDLEACKRDRDESIKKLQETLDHEYASTVADLERELKEKQDESENRQNELRKVTENFKTFRTTKENETKKLKEEKDTIRKELECVKKEKEKSSKY